jgi:hypothetical protein
MIVDRGTDFSERIYSTLMQHGSQMWLFRDRADGITTRALNSYRGDHRESVPQFEISGTAYNMVLGFSI